MNEEKHYHGHRQRLRTKFLEKGADSLADYELLELLLMQAIPRRDVKPLAKDLLKKFGNLSNILEQPISELTSQKGIGETVATSLKLAHSLAKNYRKEAVKKKDIFSSKIELIDYLYSKFAGLTHEEFHVIYLDSKNKLIADECLFRGTINSSAVYPREIVKEALDKGAAGIILAHNHPSGDPEPSIDDHIVTTEIFSVAKPLSITVHDHIIIGDGAHFSFKDSGKL